MLASRRRAILPALLGVLYLPPAEPELQVLN